MKKMLSVIILGLVMLSGCQSIKPTATVMAGATTGNTL